MKSILKLTATLGMLIMMGCSSNSSELRPLNGGCNNPNCTCPKPCQCGSNCKCGQNGNSKSMATENK
ncbi:hypothetical protein [Sulfurimonas sp.]|uniref:hypothetical protein n=1 Tax=Sulfurimonas sp. TaxID=2022749 RepID=UPI003D1286FE